MNVSHHLTDETLQDYAAGSLTMPMETLVACHLTVCSSCRSKAQTSDNIGGSLFDGLDSAPVELSAAQLIERAASMPAFSAPAMSAPIESGIPRPLARLLPVPMKELDWRRIGTGIKQHNLSSQHRKHGAFQLLHLDRAQVLLR